jgi:hypothetical protein
LSGSFDNAQETITQKKNYKVKPATPYASVFSIKAYVMCLPLVSFYFLFLLILRTAGRSPRLARGDADADGYYPIVSDRGFGRRRRTHHLGFPPTPRQPHLGMAGTGDGRPAGRTMEEGRTRRKAELGRHVSKMVVPNMRHSCRPSTAVEDRTCESVTAACSCCSLLAARCCLVPHRGPLFTELDSRRRRRRLFLLLFALRSCEASSSSPSSLERNAPPLPVPSG